MFLSLSLPLLLSSSPSSSSLADPFQLLLMSPCAQQLLAVAALAFSL